MMRVLFNLLVVLSLMICIATLIVWVRSYRHLTTVLLSKPPAIPGEPQWALSAAGGALYLSSRESNQYVLRSMRIFDVSASDLSGDVLGDPDFSMLGFAYQHERRNGFVQGQPRAWRTPLWFIAMATASLPLTRLARTTLVRRRRRIGCCAVCGYDLRASPGRCPECGETPPL